MEPGNGGSSGRNLAALLAISPPLPTLIHYKLQWACAVENVQYQFDKNVINFAPTTAAR